MNPAGRAQAVKAWAAEEGFDACGIAAVSPIDPDGRLNTWLDSGFHAGMTWMETTREVRRDASRKLPGARSVVVVARNYNGKRPETKNGTGRVARYAWGRDYHNALKKPLRRIANHIAAFEEDADCYASIDTGPVMEKAWAMRAGVGWIGKNSLVLRKGLGSYFFLATIITTVELEPDAPAFDQCGSCTLCIDACPTDAIVEPRVIDSHRCIAYHTIENRGDIPEPLHEDFGDWVFGCDICQEVCPWNRKAPETDAADFRPRDGHDQLDLTELAALDEDTFRDRYTGTPLFRTQLSGLQRNGRIAAKNGKMESQSKM